MKTITVISFAVLALLFCGTSLAAIEPWPDNGVSPGIWMANKPEPLPPDLRDQQPDINDFLDGQEGNNGAIACTLPSGERVWMPRGSTCDFPQAPVEYTSDPAPESAPESNDAPAQDWSGNWVWDGDGYVQSDDPGC